MRLFVELILSVFVYQTSHYLYLLDTPRNQSTHSRSTQRSGIDDIYLGIFNYYIPPSFPKALFSVVMSTRLFR